MLRTFRASCGQRTIATSFGTDSLLYPGPLTRLGASFFLFGLINNGEPIPRLPCVVRSSPTCYSTLRYHPLCGTRPRPTINAEGNNRILEYCTCSGGEGRLAVSPQGRSAVCKADSGVLCIEFRWDVSEYNVCCSNHYNLSTCLSTPVSRTIVLAYIPMARSADDCRA